MADQYITDPALLAELDKKEVMAPEIKVTPEGYVSDPELLKQLGTLQSAVEQNAPPSFIEDITAPQPRRPFQVGNIVPDVLIGAGLGTVLPGVGTIGGGVAGAASGLTGELLRSMGRSKAEVFTGELLGGFAEGAVKKLGSKAISIIDYKTGKAADLMKSVSSDEERAILKAKEKVFGPSTFEGLYSTKNSDALQNTLKSQLQQSGVVVDDTMKASSIVRDSLYNDLKALKSEVTVSTQKVPAEYDSFGMLKTPERIVTKAQPNVFFNSPEFKELRETLTDLKIRDTKIVDDADIGYVFRKFKNELNPKVPTKDAHQDIINMIQNGGVYVAKDAPKDIKVSISSTTQDEVRKSFNKFLERNLGEQKYNILKNVEQQEIVAAARDSIGTIVDTQFKKLDVPYKNALENIAKSPEAKADFVKAVNQHFLQLGKITTKGGKEFGTEATLDGLKKEFIRLQPSLEETGALTKPQLVELRQKLYQIPKDVKYEKIKQLFVDPFQSALAGTAAAELTRGGRDIYSSVMPL